MIRSRPSQDQLLEWMQSLSNWGRWGPDDQRGTLNLVTPDVTRRALGLPREGVTVSCARRITYEAALDSPRPPQHYMLATGEGYRPGEGPDRQVVTDYFGLVFHGHTITHIDSLAHFMWDGKLYNGVSSRRITANEGATSHSIDAAYQGIVTRGVLVDAPMLRGVELVERGDGVGLDDIARFEAQSGVKVGEGDVLLLRTGQLGHRERTGPVDVAKVGSAGPLPELLPLVRERAWPSSGPIRVTTCRRPATTASRIRSTRSASWPWACGSWTTRGWTTSRRPVASVSAGSF
ncbi:MAG: cyclase family protein [Chloroflexi bacterium]|nr:cyclase family protein [Chloroflexota bacterium]